jgi:hypothetical protein
MKYVVPRVVLNKEMSVGNKNKYVDTGFVLSCTIAQLSIRYAWGKYRNWAFTLLSLTRVSSLNKMLR